MAVGLNSLSVGFSFCFFFLIFLTFFTRILWRWEKKERQGAVACGDVGWVETERLERERKENRFGRHVVVLSLESIRHVRLSLYSEAQDNSLLFFFFFFFFIFFSTKIRGKIFCLAPDCVFFFRQFSKIIYYYNIFNRQE